MKMNIIYLDLEILNLNAMVSYIHFNFYFTNSRKVVVKNTMTEKQSVYYYMYIFKYF